MLSAKNKITRAAAIILAAGIITGLNGNDNTPARSSISYHDYVKEVSAKMPELKKNRIQILKAKNTADRAGSSSDTYLQGSGGYTKNTQYSNQYNGSGYTDDYSLNLGLSRKITQTGTTLGAGAGYSRTTTEFPGMLSQNNGTNYYPSYYVSFSQSILKNGFGIADRFPVQDAEMKLEIEKLKSAESDKSDLNGVRKLFFDWIEYSARIELLTGSVNNARVLLGQVNRKYRSGLAGQEDVQNSSAALLQYQANREESAASLRNSESQIGVYLDTAKYSPDRNEFEKFFTSVIRTELQPVAFENTRGADIYRLMKKNYIYSHSVAENSLMPQLDVTGKYLRKTKNDDAAASFSSINDSEYYLGFSAGYPLGNTESEGSVKAIELAVAELQLDFEAAKNSYTKNISSVLENISSLKKIISLTEKRITALELKYAAELRKYNQAGMDLNILINTMNSVLIEKVNLLSLKKRLIYLHLDYSDLTEK